MQSDTERTDKQDIKTRTSLTKFQRREILMSMEIINGLLKAYVWNENWITRAPEVFGYRKLLVVTRTDKVIVFGKTESKQSLSRRQVSS